MKTVNFRGNELQLCWGFYEDGTRSLQLKTQDGSRYCTASVSVRLSALELAAVSPSVVLIKDWSENQGVLAVLEAAGIIGRTGHGFFAAHCYVHICNILVPIEEVN